ncbi:MAG: tRNA (guanosine(46)-N7)-methyltransferase TrmB [bacterium]|nr:tRNA (guanosine(46)-N7)-methyltransferase TrmB [bacterium]
MILKKEDVESTEEKSTHRLKAFGRKMVKLSATQKAFLEELLPDFQIPFKPGIIDPAACFSVSGPLHLEIGFGGGEYTAALAAACPRHRIIGCEIFLNGIASLLKKIEAEGLENIRIIHGSAIIALEEMFANETFDFIHINHPDPWPKKRHLRRRLIQPEMVETLSRVLKPGGEVWLSTDVAEYLEWMAGCFGLSKELEFIKTDGRFLDSLQEDKLSTRYERRGLAAGRGTGHLRYRKIG